MMLGIVEAYYGTGNVWKQFVINEITKCEGYLSGLKKCAGCLEDREGYEYLLYR